jgi:hypothetical protein
MELTDGPIRIGPSKNRATKVHISVKTKQDLD